MTGVAGRAPRGKAKSGLGFVGCRVDLATSKTLRQIAADNDVAINTLVARGICHVLRQYARPISPELQDIAAAE